jgi:hypothetical protein
MWNLHVFSLLRRVHQIYSCNGLLVAVVRRSSVCRCIIASHSTNTWRTSYIFLHLFHSSLALQPFLASGLFFSFVIFLYTDDRTTLTSDQPVARPLHAQRTTQTELTNTQISIKWVRFEPTISLLTDPNSVLCFCADVLTGWPMCHNSLIGPSIDSQLTN